MTVFERRMVMACNLGLMAGFALTLTPYALLSAGGLVLLLVTLLVCVVLRRRWHGAELATSHLKGLIRTFWVVNGQMAIAIMIAGMIIATRAEPQSIELLTQQLQAGTATPQTIQNLVHQFFLENHTLFLYTLLACFAPVYGYIVFKLGRGFTRAQKNLGWH